MMTSTRFLVSAWAWDLQAVILAGLILAGYLLAFGVQKRIGFLLASLGILFLALMSPLGTLAEGFLFSAHMLQHILLLLIVPALLLLSLPPQTSFALLNRVPGHLAWGWIGGVGAMWCWHVPQLCNAAAVNRSVQAIQTLSLVLLGIAFWHPILAPRPQERLGPPSAICYLFSACVACSLLGIIITLSPVTVCSAYTLPVADALGIQQMIRNDWGITPERDQQIGGLLMWVPMCLIYLTAIFAQLVRWFGHPVQPAWR